MCTPCVYSEVDSACTVVLLAEGSPPPLAVACALWAWLMWDPVCDVHRDVSIVTPVRLTGLNRLRIDTNVEYEEVYDCGFGYRSGANSNTEGVRRPGTLACLTRARLSFQSTRL